VDTTDSAESKSDLDSLSYHCHDQDGPGGFERRKPDGFAGVTFLGFPAGKGNLDWRAGRLVTARIHSRSKVE
jgi:hypothetical protein